MRYSVGKRGGRQVWVRECDGAAFEVMAPRVSEKHYPLFAHAMEQGTTIEDVEFYPLKGVRCAHSMDNDGFLLTTRVLILVIGVLLVVGLLVVALRLG